MEKELEQHHQLKDSLKEEITKVFTKNKITTQVALEVLAEMIVNTFTVKQTTDVSVPMENELNKLLVNMSQGAHKTCAKIREDIINNAQ